MFNWLRAWVKAWAHTQKVQRGTEFRRYFREYVDSELKQQEEAMKDAVFYVLAMRLMGVAAMIGAIIDVMGLVCGNITMILLGVLLIVCVDMSMKFLTGLGQIREDAKRYAFEMIRGE